MLPAAAAPPLPKGARTRQALLEAAVAQFATAGLRGASVPAVARAVGIGPSAVYAYFPSKRALFEAAVDSDVSGLIVEALPDLLQGSFGGNFADVFTRLLRALPHHPLARRILSGGEDAGAERLAILPAEVRLQAGIARALRRGQEDGTVRSDIPVETMASGLETIVVSLLLSMLQTGCSVDDATSQGVLTVLEASIRPSR